MAKKKVEFDKEALVKLSYADGRVIKEGQLEFVIGSNGIFKKVSTSVASGYVKVNKIPFVPEVDDKIYLNLPAKIPLSLYVKVYRYFATYPDLEAMVLIFWNRETKKYFIYKPKLKKVSKAGVEWDDHGVIDIVKKHMLVAEIHSHNDMGSFFSGTDDGDENKGIVYGVMSITNLCETTFRIKALDYEYDLEFEDVVDMPDYPDSWDDDMKKAVDADKNKAITGGQKDFYDDFPDWKDWQNWGEDLKDKHKYKKPESRIYEDDGYWEKGEFHEYKAEEKTEQPESKFVNLDGEVMTLVEYLRRRKEKQLELKS